MHFSFLELLYNNLQVHIKLLPCCIEVWRYGPTVYKADVSHFDNYVIKYILPDAESCEEHNEF